MPAHDWTLVDAGIFHAFHTAWAPELQKKLNSGLLPRGYYALAEQHAGRAIADLLTLHVLPPDLGAAPSGDAPLAGEGGTAVAQAPPRAYRRQTIEAKPLARRRSLAIRHVSGHRLVALLEVLSPANKDRRETVDEFAAKAVGALDLGVHLMLVDLFPLTRHDPNGMHSIIRQRLEQSAEPDDLPAETPLTLASYAAGPQIEVYLRHIAVGDVLPDMPLFLRPDRHIDVPLEATYCEAYSGIPEFWRNVLEEKNPPSA